MKQTFIELYQITNTWMEAKPWLKLWSNDWIKISFSPDEEYYCTVIGKANDCIGLSIYQGDEGFQDLATISDPDYLELGSTYIMHDQNCLTFSMGDRQQVPPEQKEMIKKLSHQYLGRDAWPFFLSMKKRYYPIGINEQEAKIFIKVMKQLLVTIEEYHPLIEKDYLLHTYLKDGQWDTILEKNTKYSPKYQTVKLNEPQLIHELNTCPRINQRIIIDLVYLNLLIKDVKSDRPLNALMIIAYDLKSQTIIYQSLLNKEDEEINTCLSFFVSYAKQIGLPKQILVRNPLVFSSLEYLCEECNVELVETQLEIIDEIINEMKQMMGRKNAKH